MPRTLINSFNERDRFTDNIKRILPAGIENFTKAIVDHRLWTLKVVTSSPLLITISVMESAICKWDLFSSFQSIFEWFYSYIAGDKLKNRFLDLQTQFSPQGYISRRETKTESTHRSRHSMKLVRENVNYTNLGRKLWNGRLFIMCFWIKTSSLL